MGQSATVSQVRNQHQTVVKEQGHFEQHLLPQGILAVARMG